MNTTTVNKKKDRHRKGSRLNVAISPEIHAQVQDIADSNHRPLRNEVELALLAHIKNHMASLKQSAPPID